MFKFDSSKTIEENPIFGQNSSIVLWNSLTSRHIDIDASKNDQKLCIDPE